MSKKSDQALGWFVLIAFFWWVLQAQNPPEWATEVAYTLGLIVVGLVLIGILRSDLVGDWVKGWKERRRSRKLRLDGVDEMGGHEFERYVAAMLEERGYSVERRGGSHDFGADAIAARRGDRYIVQAKHRGAGWKVGSKPVRATIGARNKHDCTGAMAVTNRYFTESAREQAGQVCELIDRSDLARWIDQTSG